MKEAGAQDVFGAVNNPTYQISSKTPELYLGYARIESLASPENIDKDTVSEYTSPPRLAGNQFAYEGSWNIAQEYANPQKGAVLTLNFESKEVYLVMRTKQSAAQVKVYVDEKLQYFGKDNNEGTVTVVKDTLYRLVDLPSPGRHILKLEFEDNNAELFAFTFG